MAAAQSQINYYEVLGVPATATVHEIRTAYHTRISRYHPDRNSSKQATAVAVLLNAAWEKLGDPECRRRYDSEMGFGNATSRGTNAVPRAIVGAPFLRLLRRQLMHGPTMRDGLKTRPLNDRSRSVADAREPVASQQLRSHSWSVRVLGVLLIGAGVVCGVLSIPRGAPSNDWEVLLFWVCVSSAIYCVRRSGLGGTVAVARRLSSGARTQSSVAGKRRKRTLHGCTRNAAKRHIRSEPVDADTADDHPRGTKTVSDGPTSFR